MMRLWYYTCCSSHVQAKKSNFGAVQLYFLGFTIPFGIICPGPRTQVIQGYPPPENAHEVRRFLDLMGYFRRFIVNYAKLVAPLTQLTDKDVPFHWDELQESFFNFLKKQLYNNPVVIIYDSKTTVTQ